MLTAIRALAEEADARDGRASRTSWPPSSCEETRPSRRHRSSSTSSVRRAWSTRAAGLVEIVRGITAHVRGEPLPEAPASEPLSVDAVHLETSRYRYCTVYVVEGEGLDSDALERDLVGLGDSLLVVGDPSALKVHVHTNDPGAALRAGTALGVLERVEIANMHVQTAQREERLSQSADVERTTDVVAVVTGDGNRRLFESLGAAALVEGGETMNPSTDEILDGIDRTRAPEAVVLANNPNVIMAAEQAARLATKPVKVIPSRSLTAGLAAMVGYEGARTADENAAEMESLLADVSTGAVTIASRTIDVDGMQVARGAYLGLVDGEAIAGGTTFDAVASSVVDQLLAEPRDVLTLITGADEPELGSSSPASPSTTPSSSSRFTRAASRTIHSCCPPNERSRPRGDHRGQRRLPRGAGDAPRPPAGLEVVASAPDGDAAATLCREHSPDVLLMDYRLPGMDGVQATRLLLEACPEVAVVGLTASANQSEVEALLAAGAVACLTKDEPLEDIVAAIHRAAAQ